MNDAMSTLAFPIRLQGRRGDPQSRVQQAVDLILNGKQNPRVMEAGCGSLSRVQLPQGRHLVGIDISQRQLDRNTQLNEKILGDLQSFPLPTKGFDLVLCWDVIEHLPDPTKALERMASTLNPGGAMVLAFPNLWSLKGLVTKFTPYGIHALFYKYIIGDKRSSAEWDQFPTYFRYAIAPPQLRQWARDHGLDIAFEETYEGPVQTHMRGRSRLMDLGFGALGLVSRALTFGALDLGLSDTIMVLRKPARG
jgi:2-polyprenyl-3-methyl-5-hydroxy-6-metoxy-1,4-benzoquinol methylase